MKYFKTSCQTFNYLSQLALLPKGVSPFSQEVFQEGEVPARQSHHGTEWLFSAGRQAEAIPKTPWALQGHRWIPPGTHPTASSDHSWILQKCCGLGQNEEEFPLWCSGWHSSQDPWGINGSFQAKGVKEGLPVMLPWHSAVPVLISMPGKTMGNPQMYGETATEMSRDLKNMLCTYQAGNSTYIFCHNMLSKSGTS